MASNSETLSSLEQAARERMVNKINQISWEREALLREIHQTIDSSVSDANHVLELEGPDFSRTFPGMSQQLEACLNSLMVLRMELMSKMFEGHKISSGDHPDVAPKRSGRGRGHRPPGSTDGQGQMMQTAQDVVSSSTLYSCQTSTHKPSDPLFSPGSDIESLMDVTLTKEQEQEQEQEEVTPSMDIALHCLSNPLKSMVQKRKSGRRVTQEKPLNVWYNGIPVDFRSKLNPQKHMKGIHLRNLVAKSLSLPDRDTNLLYIKHCLLSGDLLDLELPCLGMGPRERVDILVIPRNLAILIEANDHPLEVIVKPPPLF